MRVSDASTSISAEFGGIRDSCLDIYHLIMFHHNVTLYLTIPSKWCRNTQVHLWGLFITSLSDDE